MGARTTHAKHSSAALPRRGRVWALGTEGAGGRREEYRRGGTAGAAPETRAGSLLSLVIPQVCGGRSTGLGGGETRSPEAELGPQSQGVRGDAGSG